MYYGGYRAVRTLEVEWPPSPMVWIAPGPAMDDFPLFIDLPLLPNNNVDIDIGHPFTLPS